MSYINGLLNGGALPALEKLAQFSHERHKVLAHSIANISTPFFRPVDLDVNGFQAALGDAIERRRETINPVRGELQPRDTMDIRFGPDGIDARPRATNQGIMFHDHNNRDLERLMQYLSENTATHNAAIDMIRNQFQMLQMAIRERV